MSFEVASLMLHMSHTLLMSFIFEVFINTTQNIPLSLPHSFLPLPSLANSLALTLAHAHAYALTLALAITYDIVSRRHRLLNLVAHLMDYLAAHLVRYLTHNHLSHKSVINTSSGVDEHHIVERNRLSPCRAASLQDRNSAARLNIQSGTV